MMNEYAVFTNCEHRIGADRIVTKSKAEAIKIMEGQLLADHISNYPAGEIVDCVYVGKANPNDTEGIKSPFTLDI